MTKCTSCNQLAARTYYGHPYCWDCLMEVLKQKESQVIETELALPCAMCDRYIKGKVYVMKDVGVICEACLNNPSKHLFDHAAIKPIGEVLKCG